MLKEQKKTKNNIKMSDGFLTEFLKYLNTILTNQNQNYSI
jgi:hypothetical protein